MLLRLWSSLKGYLFALLVNALAVGLTFWLSPLMGPIPYPFFVLAVGASAWLYEIGPGLLSTVLAFLATDYYFDPPLYDITLTKQDGSTLLLFLLVTTIVVSIIRTRKQSAEAQAQLGAIVAGAQEAIVRVGLDGNIVSWNAGAERVFGYQAREAIGQSIHLISPPDTSPEMDENLSRASGGESTSQWETVQCDRSGKEIAVSVSIAPIRDKDGKISSLSLIASDISERKRAEAQDRQKAAQIEVQRHLLEQREQERQQIARDLHDGPVQALTGATLALRRAIMDLAASEITPQLEAIQVTLQEQIGELRNYAGELRPPSLAKFGLERAVRSHMDGFQDKHPEIRMQFEDRSQDGSSISAERSLALFRIYQESLTNIVKHAKATEVKVCLSKTSSEAHLEIQDNGVGFESTGDWLELARHGHLGLVGMRERAEAAGGALVIRSYPGQGTRIQATIPLEETGEDFQK